MSNQRDSQKRSEEHVQMSDGSDPSSTSDDGSRSTPSNLPKDQDTKVKEICPRGNNKVIIYFLIT